MIPQNMLYDKQGIFEYRDKPGKQLARVLSGTSVSRSIPALINQKGEEKKDDFEKLDVFVDFY